MVGKLEALVMELEDTATELLAGVVATADEREAFTDIDVALLVGARPRGPGMERKDLLQARLVLRCCRRSLRVFPPAATMPNLVFGPLLSSYAHLRAMNLHSSAHILCQLIALFDRIARYLQANADIFRKQGEALDRYAKKSVKVLVVGNPANTNALIASRYAPSIPKENFTALTRESDWSRALF